MDLDDRPPPPPLFLSPDIAARVFLSVAAPCHTPSSSAWWYDPCRQSCFCQQHRASAATAAAAALGSTAAKHSGLPVPSHAHTHTHRHRHTHSGRRRGAGAHKEIPSSVRKSLRRPLSASETIISISISISTVASKPERSLLQHILPGAPWWWWGGLLCLQHLQLQKQDLGMMALRQKGERAFSFWPFFYLKDEEEEEGGGSRGCCSIVRCLDTTFRRWLLSAVLVCVCVCMCVVMLS